MMLLIEENSHRISSFTIKKKYIKEYIAFDLLHFNGRNMILETLLVEHLPLTGHLFVSTLAKWFRNSYTINFYYKINDKSQRNNIITFELLQLSERICVCVREIAFATLPSIIFHFIRVKLLGIISMFTNCLRW